MRVLVHHGGQRWGPFSLEELQRALAEGRFQPGDLAWHEGLPAWVPLSSIVPAPASIPTTSLVGTEAAKPAIPTSGLAVASLALGASSTFFCFLAGIPAVICGHLARAEIRRAGGRLNGDGMAVAGLVLGYLSLAACIAIAVFFLFFAGVVGLTMPHASITVQPASAPQHIKNAASQVFYACKAFAADNGGRYPETLEDLVPFYLQDRTLLTCPLSPGEEVGYFYFGGKDTDAPSEPLMMSKGADDRGQHLVVGKDGSLNLRHHLESPNGATVHEGSGISGAMARTGSAR